MKKALSLLLALVMVFSFAACSGGGGGGTDGEKTVYNVGVCIYKFDDNFMTLYRNEIESYFAEPSNDEVEYKVTIVDGKNDQNEQTNQIESFIADQVDVLIINLVNSSSAASVIEMVDSAGIPTVFINREPTAEDMALSSNITYVGADARQSGTFQGEIIRDLPDKGDINGDGIVSYVMIIGDPENVDAQYRTEFSVKALTDGGIEVDELMAQRGDWDRAKGQEIANTALVQFGDEIDVIFCNNDAMALGAIEAIALNGRTCGTDIYLVGVDALDEAVTAVKEGKMTGTVLNDHIGQSHTAVEVAIKMLKGESFQKNYTVDYVKVEA